MSGLLQKMRMINNMLQKKGGVVNTELALEGQLPFNDMAGILADILDVNAYLIDDTGNLLGLFF